MPANILRRLLLLVWHVRLPLGVHSNKRRLQSPEWTILSHADCLIQGEVVRLLCISNMSVHHCECVALCFVNILQRARS